MTSTLYVAISAHGYGHIAQTAPVVNELWRRDPRLRVVVECGWSRDHLATRFRMPFEHLQVSTDFGMVMKNALEADIEASHARYVELHARLDEEVQASARRLQTHSADLLLGNIPYIPLLAAQRAGVSSIAMCCLNWADIYAALCSGMPGSDGIHAEMVAAYQKANPFLAPQPTMPMPTVFSARQIGPIGRVGRSTKRELQSRLRFERLVLVTMGGIETRLNFDAWPKVDGVVWAVPDGAQVKRDDLVRHSDFGVPFIDLLASSDALITKPGYGAFAEAACNAIPVLYVPRADWPEARYLTAWLHERGHCLEISGDELSSRRLGERLAALWALPERAPVQPTGIGEAADVIEGALPSQQTSSSGRKSAGCHD